MPKSQLPLPDNTPRMSCSYSPEPTSRACLVHFAGSVLLSTGILISRCSQNPRCGQGETSGWGLDMRAVSHVHRPFTMQSRASAGREGGGWGWAGTPWTAVCSCYVPSQNPEKSKNSPSEPDLLICYESTRVKAGGYNLFC